MKQIYFVAALLLSAGFLKTQAQFVYPNDVCSGAIQLDISNSSELHDTLFLSDGFADPSLSTIPHCSGSTTLIKNDLWYSFTATDTILSIVTQSYPAAAGLVFYQLFTNTCGNLTSVSCYANSANNKMSGLTIGQHYYLRSYYPNGLGNPYSAFNVSLISKPVNDDCDAAMLLPVFSALTDGSKTNHFTNDLASITLAPCATVNSGWNTMKDVWYKFVASSPEHTILIQIPVSSGAKAAVYSGNPGSLTAIANFGFVSTTSVEIKSLTNLVAGTTYYIRFGCTSTINFNVGIYKNAPANDDCSNADTVLMSSSANCENNFIIGNRLTATNSTGTCASSATKDVWLIFKATAPAITVIGQQDAGTGLMLGLLQGNCGALTCLVNGTSSTFSYSGLTVGNYYYLQAGGSSEERIATICISPKITNDECSGAITLPVKPYNQLRNTVAYTGAATQSMPGCTGSNGIKDLWYKFTATDTASLVTMDGGGTFQLFTGDCGTLSSIHCSSGTVLAQGVTERTEKVSGLTVGVVYYLRIYPPNTGSQTLYTIDVNALPGADECAGATWLQPQQGLAYEPLSNNGILYAAESLPPCSATTSTKDIWYKFTATGANAAIMSNRETGDLGSTVMGFQVYSGDCGSLNSIACFSQRSVLHRAQTFTNFVAGQTYYIRQYGNFEKNRITIVNAPVNDEMTGAIKLSPSPSNVQSIPSYYTHGASKKFGKICASSTNPMNHDVWFYFIAETATHTASISTANSYWAEQSTGYSYTIEAFRGYAADSVSLLSKLISCANNNNSLAFSGLTAGDTIYLRVANAATAGNTSIFSIKISNTQNINEPDGALLLSSLNNYQFSLSTAGATQSLPAAGCMIPDFPDDDIWFKFIHAADIKRIVAGLESKDITMQLFSGTPGNLIPLQCSSNIMVLPAALTNGILYYLRAYSKANAQAASFSIGLFGEAGLLENECISDINLLGPNLVENPRCEADETYLVPLITGGPGHPGKKLASGWWSASHATPDTWNADYPSGFGNVPDNGTSYGTNKIPRSGKGMIGMLNYSQGGIWSEYATGKLKQPLVKGKTYFVSFYVNFADEYPKTSYNVGALFSNDSIHADLYTDVLELTPNIAFNAAAASGGANDWRQVCGYVYADRSYSFITIGNFGSQVLYGGPTISYFFIGDVTVAEATVPVLPLRLLDFNGRMNSMLQSELHWQTAGETGTKYFEVQWRTDTGSFNPVGIVQAAGTSTTNKYYHFMHANPGSGSNYYRLKMVDADGRFTYSPVIKIGLSSKINKLSVNPNPVSNTLNVMAVIEKDEMIFFRIIGTDGRTVATKYKLLKKGSSVFSWDISILAKGNYFLVTTSSVLQPVNIVKQ